VRALRFILPALIIATMVACALRTAFRQPLSYDEVATINESTGIGFSRLSQWSVFSGLVHDTAFFTPADYWRRATLAGVFESTRQDNGHALPHHIVLHYWIAVVGASPLSVRLFSVLCIAGAAGIFYRLAGRWTGRRGAALLALFLFCGHTLLLQYAGMARMYAPAVLLLLATVACLDVARLRLWVGKPWRAFLFGAALLGALAVMTHYFAALALAVAAVYNGRVFWRKERGALLLAAALAFAILAGWLWWAGAAHSIAGVVTGHQQARAGTFSHTVFTPLNERRFLVGWLGSLFGSTASGTYPELDLKFLVSAALFAGWCALAAAALRCTIAPEKAVARLAFSVVVVYAIVMPLLALATGFVLPLSVRYWIFATPFALVLTAIGASAAWRMRRGFLRLALLGCAAALMLRTAFTLAAAGFAVDAQRTDSRETSVWTINATSGDPYYTFALGAARTAGPTDTLVFRRWSEAHLVNLFLRHRPTQPERLDTAQQATITVHRAASGKAIVLLPASPLNLFAAEPE